MSDNVQTQGRLATMLAKESYQAEMNKVLPRHLTSERMARVALTQIRKNPKLANCTPESFMACMMTCSEVGLEPDGRKAHLIPFNDNKRGTVECQVIFDYKGLIELVLRSGEVLDWEPIPIYEGDIFSWKNGEVEHEMDLTKAQGKMIGGYSKIILKDGTKKFTRPMRLEEMDKRRKVSKAKNSGPWQDWTDEMRLKSVVRRDFKYLPISNEMQLALEKDFDQIDEKLVKDITAEVKVDSRLNDLDEEKPAAKKASKKKAAKKAAKKTTSRGLQQGGEAPPPEEPQEPDPEIMSKDQIVDAIKAIDVDSETYLEVIVTVFDNVAVADALEMQSVTKLENVLTLLKDAAKKG